MDLQDFKKSNYLGQSDIGEGKLVTIKAVESENIALEDDPPDMKVCIHFNELAKPLICNSTNAQIIAKITGFDKEVETNWIGAEIVLYVDPNVSFGGKLVGGVRVRAPKHAVPKNDLPF